MSTLKDFKQEINEMSSQILDLEVAKDIYEETRDDIATELAEIGNKLKSLIMEDVVNNLNDISVTISEDKMSQITNFPIEVNAEDKNNYAKILNTDVENVNCSVDVYSNIGNPVMPIGQIVDMIAKIENTLTKYTLEIPLDDNQKKEILESIDTKFRRDTKETIGHEIGLEEALSNENYLCLSVDEISLMAKMAKLTKELDVYDTQLIPNTAQQISDLQNKIAITAQLFTGSEQEALDAKIQNGATKALEQAFNHVANGLSDIGEGLKQIGQIEVPNPFVEIKKASISKIFNNLKERTGEFLAKTALVFSKVQPASVIDSIGNFATKNEITLDIATHVSNTISKITSKIDITKAFNKDFAYSLSVQIQDAKGIVDAKKSYDKATDYRDSLRKDIQDDEHKLDVFFDKKNELQSKIEMLNNKVAECKDINVLLRATEKNASGGDKVILASEIKDNALELLKLNKQLVSAENKLSKINAKIDRTIISLSNHETSLDFAKEQQNKANNEIKDKQAKMSNRQSDYTR